MMLDIAVLRLYDARKSSFYARLWPRLGKESLIMKKLLNFVPYTLTSCSETITNACKRCVPPSSDAIVWCNIDSIGMGVITDGEPQISDQASQVLLHQNVLRLYITMSYGRFPLESMANK